MALAVGLANSEVEFVFPTSKEVVHPFRRELSGITLRDNNVATVRFCSTIVRATGLLARRRAARGGMHGKGRVALV